MRKYAFWVVFILVCFASVGRGVDAASLAERAMQGLPIRVLLVPGHDQTTVGAAYLGMREVDMTLALAQKIKTQLSADPRFQVTVSRTDTGYFSELQRYFDRNRRTVDSFVKAQKRKMERAIERGTIDVAEQVPHADTAADPAYRLYATSRWADQKGFDLILHIHFNDYGAHKRDTMGEYTGYSIYVPDPQLKSSSGTQDVAEAISETLGRVWNSSTNPTESSKSDSYGIIRDMNLIALGSYQTLETPSILVEYGYIYQPELSTDFFRISSDVFAGATAKGLQKLVRGNIESIPTDVLTVSYNWQKNLSRSKNPVPDPDVLALQFALSEHGFYPPLGKTRTECPFTGRFGDCTHMAVVAFQTAHSLRADGKVGPATFSRIKK